LSKISCLTCRLIATQINVRRRPNMIKLILRLLRVTQQKKWKSTASVPELVSKQTSKAKTEVERILKMHNRHKRDIG
jgi:hypothetical protein